MPSIDFLTSGSPRLQCSKGMDRNDTEYDHGCADIPDGGQALLEHDGSQDKRTQDRAAYEDSVGNTQVHIHDDPREDNIVDQLQTDPQKGFVSPSAALRMAAATALSAHAITISI